MHLFTEKTLGKKIEIYVELQLRAVIKSNQAVTITCSNPAPAQSKPTNNFKLKLVKNSNLIH